MDSQDWEAQLHECLAQSSIMEEGCFRCWLDDAELPKLTAEAAEVHCEEGPRGRCLSCAAAVHLPLPEAGITLQACKRRCQDPWQQMAQHGFDDTAPEVDAHALLISACRWASRTCVAAEAQARS